MDHDEADFEFDYEMAEYRSYDDPKDLAYMIALTERDYREASRIAGNLRVEAHTAEEKEERLRDKLENLRTKFDLMMVKRGV